MSEQSSRSSLLFLIKPFHRATTAISASSYPTLSMLSPPLYKLSEKVLKVVKEDTPLRKAFKEATLTDLNRRYFFTKPTGADSYSGFP